MDRIRLISLQSEPIWPTVLMSLGCFWAPFAVTWITLGWREVGRLRGERRKDQAEAEALRSEGFPPPGPPTTDSLTAD